MNMPFNESWLAVASFVLCAHVAAGVAVGLIFFRALWWNTLVIVGGGSISAAIALTVSRFIFVGGLMTLAAFEGAAPLAASSLGVFIGRSFVLRSIGKNTR
jgi:hypothetical protein